jgi:hypothetical protein
VRTADSTLLVGKGRPELTELYDPVADPREQRNLSRAEPERTKELEPLVEEFLRQQVPWGSAVEVEIDEIRRDQLRALGYVFDREKDELRKTDAVPNPRPAKAAKP